jgi:arylsulfatase A-like enzyme
LLLVPGASCDAPAPDSVVRIVDFAEEPTFGAYHSRDGGDAGGEVVFDGASATHWEPIARMDQDASADELATFLEYARVLPDGVLRLGRVRGAWATAIDDVEPSSVLELSAHARIDGLDVGGDGRRGVRMLLVELREPPTSFALTELQRVEVTRTWGLSMLGDGVEQDTSLVVRTSNETRALALFFFLNLLPPDDAAHVEWSDIRLTRRGRLALLAAASDAPDVTPESGRITVAPFTIAQTRRPSIGVLAGDTAVVDVTLPRADSRLDLWLGLVPYRFAPVGPAARLSVDLALPGRDGARQIELDLDSLPAAAARWHHVSVPVPPAFAGRTATLRFAVTSDSGSPLIGAFATPRIVPRPAARPSGSGRNVVVVSLDTLRADRVGCYGNERDTTPSIDALGREALLFEHAWSAAPYTLPSHASLLSGQLPGVHGAERPGSRIDPVRTKLLAELLYDRGWATAAFTGGGFVDPDFGFARGFESYGTVDPVTNLASAKLRAALESSEDRDLALVAASGVDSVIDWIEEHADQAFFLFLHTYTPHEFDPPADVLDALNIDGLDPDADRQALQRLYDHHRPTELERERLLELYDGSVRHADAATGRVFDALRRLGLWDDTIVVVTSDHGKELGEHGAVNHGHSLHRELLEVPLLIRVPGVPPARVATPVSGIDIVPTLLDALDLPLPPGIQGVSLLTRPGARPIFAEVDNVANQLALQRGDLKTIVRLKSSDASRWEDGATSSTYDVAVDPLETEPLAPDPQRLREVLEMGRSLRALRRALGGSGVEGRPLDPSTRAQLEGLGYTIGSDD